MERRAELFSRGFLMVYPHANFRSGASTREIMAINLMSILSEGPAVSLKGSPTVSPTTAARWSPEPFPPSGRDSMSFLALSHAPPALDMKIASRPPETVAPTKSPVSTAGPPISPARIGAAIADMPGRIMLFSAVCVEISTQLR